VLLRIDKDPQAATSFDVYVRGAVDAEQRRTGKTLTFDEQRHILDRAAVEIAVPGRLWGSSSKPAFELDAGDIEAIVDGELSNEALAGIPRRHVTDIIASLQSRKQAVTAEEIRELWKLAGSPGE